MAVTVPQYKRYKVTALYNVLAKMRAYHQVMSLGAGDRTDEIGRRLQRIGQELERLEADVKALYDGMYADLPPARRREHVEL